ncbi:MAG TPA: tetratricopeptide repeat protein [Candidatus Binatia bacterium]|jgi:regulator of sirC expression with transglutaminase-like and TPR domain
MEAVEDFRRLVERPDPQIDLARAALEIARDEYPELDISRYLARIDEIAAAVNCRLIDDGNVYQSLAALNHVLFRDQGFRGNREDYYNPKNSFLNDVIERKTGIPITLSVLYIEVARRIGLSLAGVGFPGHFLVKHVGQGEHFVVDPFNGGDIKSDEALAELLKEMYGSSKIPLRREFLEPVGKRQILKRMLTNLKMIYFRADDFAKALPVLQRLVIVDPESEEDIRDRGIAYLKLECFGLALADFENYLRRSPNASDGPAVKEQIINLAKQVRQIH